MIPHCTLLPIRRFGGILRERARAQRMAIPNQNIAAFLEGKALQP